eukprot:m.191502 g.191502  ORF g.191502 m.191502 type:complete len:1148 (+) comp18248_c0_seq8:114-3557(+)
MSTSDGSSDHGPVSNGDVGVSLLKTNGDTGGRRSQAAATSVVVDVDSLETERHGGDGVQESAAQTIASTEPPTRRVEQRSQESSKPNGVESKSGGVDPATKGTRDDTDTGNEGARDNTGTGAVTDAIAVTGRVCPATPRRRLRRIARTFTTLQEDQYEQSFGTGAAQATETYAGAWRRRARLQDVSVFTFLVAWSMLLVFLSVVIVLVISSEANNEAIRKLGDRAAESSTSVLGSGIAQIEMLTLQLRRSVLRTVECVFQEHVGVGPQIVAMLHSAIKADRIQMGTPPRVATTPADTFGFAGGPQWEGETAGPGPLELSLSTAFIESRIAVTGMYTGHDALGTLYGLRYMERAEVALFQANGFDSNYFVRDFHVVDQVLANITNGSTCANPPSVYSSIPQAVQYPLPNSGPNCTVQTSKMYSCLVYPTARCVTNKRWATLPDDLSDAPSVTVGMGPFDPLYDDFACDIDMASLSCVPHSSVRTTGTAYNEFADNLHSNTGYVAARRLRTVSPHFIGAFTTESLDRRGIPINANVLVTPFWTDGGNGTGLDPVMIGATWTGIATSHLIDATVQEMELLGEGAVAFVVERQTCGGCLWDRSFEVASGRMVLGTEGSLLFDNRTGRPSTAQESDSDTIRNASLFLLEKYGSWEAVPSISSEVYQFAGEECPPRRGTEFTLQDLEARSNCRLLSTLELAIENGINWLFVVVQPENSAFSVVQSQAEQAFAGIKEAKDFADDEQNTANISSALGGLAWLVVCVFIVRIVARRVSRPLRELGKDMNELASLKMGTTLTPTRMKELKEIQLNYAHMKDGIASFSKFVPVTVVRRIVRGDKQALSLFVVEKEASVMFTDIRGFTSISETLTPDVLIQVMEEYLSAMCTIIEDHNGVVGDFIGDGIMCMWNAPDEVVDHALLACKCSVAMHRALFELNVGWSARNLPPLVARVGINTGLLLAGNIGSPDKMKYGVLGDVVNLASRVENLNKEYDSVRLITEGTHAIVKDDMVTRPVDKVSVKGREAATILYEVLCVVGGLAAGADNDGGAAEKGQPGREACNFDCFDATSVDDQGLSEQDLHLFRDCPCTRQFARSSETIFLAYVAGRFSEVISLARAHLDRFGPDRAMQNLLDRSKVLEKAPPSNWKGVQVMTHK